MGKWKELKNLTCWPMSTRHQWKQEGGTSKCLGMRWISAYVMLGCCTRETESRWVTNPCLWRTSDSTSPDLQGVRRACHQGLPGSQWIVKSFQCQEKAKVHHYQLYNKDRIPPGCTCPHSSPTCKPANTAPGRGIFISHAGCVICKVALCLSDTRICFLLFHSVAKKS